MRFDDGNPQGEGARGFNPYQAPAGFEESEASEGSPSGDPVTFVAFHLRTEDLLHFQEATRPRWITPTILAFFAIVAVTFVASTIIRLRRGDLLPSLAPGSPLPLFLVVAGLTAMSLVANRFRRTSPEELAEQWTVRLAPEALFVAEVGVSETCRAWSSVSEIRETSHLILFLLHNALPAQSLKADTFLHAPSTWVHLAALLKAQTFIHVVPLRAFASPEAARSFLDTARRFHAAGRLKPLS
jgi:hypothetical protein